MRSTNKQVFYIITRNSNKKNSELLEKETLIRNLVRGIDYDIISNEEWIKIKNKYDTEIKTVNVYELWIFFMFNGETSKRLLVHGVEKLFDVIVTLFVNKMIGLEEFYSMFLVSVKGKGRINDFLLNFNDVYKMYGEKNNIISLIVKKNKENKEKESPVLYVEQKNNSKCVGLENLGNTCFMNSAIQCLQNYRKLNEFFIESNGKNINEKINKEIVEEWIELTKTMSQEKNSCIWNLRKAMGKVNIIYDRNEEQDCHEFINFLLEILHNGTKCINNNNFCKNFKNKCINKKLCINEGGWIKKIISPEYKIIGELKKVYVSNNKSINEGKNNIIVDFNSKGDQNLIITETNFSNSVNINSTDNLNANDNTNNCSTNDINNYNNSTNNNSTNNNIYINSSTNDSHNSTNNNIYINSSTNDTNCSINDNTNSSSNDNNINSTDNSDINSSSNNNNSNNSSTNINSRTNDKTNKCTINNNMNNTNSNDNNSNDSDINSNDNSNSNDSDINSTDNSDINNSSNNNNSNNNYSNNINNITGVNENSNYSVNENSNCSVNENSNYSVNENSNYSINENSNCTISENSNYTVNENSNCSVNENSNYSDNENSNYSSNNDNEINFNKEKTITSKNKKIIDEIKNSKNKTNNERYFYKKIKKKTVQDKTRFIIKGDFGELMKYWYNFLMNNNSIIYYNFYGIQLNTLRCTKCNFVKQRYEPFLSLSLPLPPQIIYHSNIIIIFEDMGSIKISVKISMLISEVIIFIKNKYNIVGLIISLGYKKKDEGYILSGKDQISEYDRIILYEYTSINNYFICSFNFKKYLFFSEKFPLEFLVEIDKSYLSTENKFCQISRIFDCGNCDNLQSSDSSIIDNNFNISYALSLYKKLLPFLVSNTQYEYFLENIKISKPTIHPLLKIPYITVSFKNKDLFLMKNVISGPKFDPPTLYTLQDCISLYLKQEIIKNTCEKCKSSTFKLFPAFVVLPNFLIIHLMRFSYTSSSESKINTFINFPVNSLQIGNAIYKLNSVANHLEIGLGYGHYIAYIRKGNDWYCCNDSVIFKTNVLDKETAYLLFYERIV